MVMAQEQRNRIARTLSPILGEEDAQAVVLHFPSRAEDEPATKEFVQLRVAELRADMAEFRGESRAKFAEASAELHKAINEQTRLMLMVAGTAITILGVLIGIASAIL